MVIGNTGALFLPPAGAKGELAWSVVVETRVRDQVDIVTLPVAGPPEGISPGSASGGATP
ncbi:hypothetical protein D3C83_200500 [compost metagenome]